MTTYGKDISCTTSLRSGQFASGVMLVAQAMFRRLTTPRGMLSGSEEEDNYGIDLTELIGQVSTQATRIALAGRIRNELMKDERLDSVAITITEVPAGPAKAFLVDIRGVTAEGSFALQLSASEVTVELLGIKVGT